jgi:DMSO/TMAO reductase YedYZ molybdopterin-dependent catalytic subunit
LVRRAGGALPEARYVLVHGMDRAWTTNLPLDDFLAEDSLVAILTTESRSARSMVVRRD